MSPRHPFADVERGTLAGLPTGAVDPARVPEFEESFGSAVVEAADIAALLVGSLSRADLAAAVERMARVLVSGLDEASDELNIKGHAWVEMAQRWAVSAYFARLREVSRDAPQGGRA